MSHVPIDKDHLEGIIDNICSINSDAQELKSISIDLAFEERDLGAVLSSFIGRGFKVEKTHYKEGELSESYFGAHFTFSRGNRKAYINFK